MVRFNFVLARLLLWAALFIVGFGLWTAVGWLFWEVGSSPTWYRVLAAVMSASGAWRTSGEILADARQRFWLYTAQQTAVEERWSR